VAPEPSHPEPRDQALILGGAVVILAIFLADLQVEQVGTAIGMLYVTPILLGLWIRLRVYPIAAAALATLLTMIDLVVGWSDPAHASVYINRPLMTLTFWVTAILVVRFRMLQDLASSRLKQLEDLKYAIDQAAIVATTDVSGRITYVNDTFCAISQYSRDELVGHDHKLVNSKYHSPEFFRELWRTIARGEVWHGELRNRAKDGTVYWVDTTIVPFLNDSGKPYQYTAIRSDITQRKVAEGKLREQEALARLGQMAAVVAHEVKNPLTGIRAAIEIMRSRRKDNDPEAPVMREIVTRIDGLHELIRDLLLFASPRPLRMTAIELRPLLQDVASALRNDPQYAEITISIDGPEVTTVADRELLRAALFNLYLNAAQAMAGRGLLSVTMRQEGSEVHIEVRDTGPGVKPELRDRIFEPFFTTKARGGGLGLPMSARSMSLHGGSLTLECPPEGGTIMHVRLPRTVPSPARVAETVAVGPTAAAPVRVD
jgi:PAS domain S-box-containing protein